jgi:hypothetical protein
MPPAPVTRSKLGPSTVPVTSGYPASFFFWSSCNILWKACVLTCLCHVSLVATSRGCATQVRHAVPPWWGAPIVDNHDRVLPGGRVSYRFCLGLHQVPCPG